MRPSLLHRSLGSFYCVYMFLKDMATKDPSRAQERMRLGVENVVVETYQVGRREDEVKVLERLGDPEALIAPL